MRLHIRQQPYVADTRVLESMFDSEGARQPEELERAQATCVEHNDPRYLDPEGDGCPRCGGGRK